MSGEPDFDRVADVLVRVALRLTKHDERKDEGDSSADSGVLSRLD